MKEGFHIAIDIERNHNDDDFLNAFLREHVSSCIMFFIDSSSYCKIAIDNDILSMFYAYLYAMYICMR